MSFAGLSPRSGPRSLPDKVPERSPFSTSKKIFFSMFTFLIFFVLVEVILGILNFPIPVPTASDDQDHWFELGFQQDPSLPWSWIPVPGGHGQIGGIPYHFNDAGFRGKRPLAARKEEVLRIICMGDSCSMGWEVADHKTFCHQLEEVLQQSLQKRVETINAGVPGYTSFQGLHQLEQRVLALDPDVIVLSYNWNDHTFAIHLHETFEVIMHKKFYGLPDKDLPKNTFYSELHSAVARLRSYQLMNRLLPQFQPAPQEPIEPSEELGDIALVPVRVAPADYRANLKQMIQIARQNDILPLLMTQPSQAIRSEDAFRELAQSLSYSAPSTAEWVRFARGMRNRFERKQREYNEILREVALEESVTLVDMVPIFGARDASDVLLDPVHPTPEGHQLIASELSQAIRKSLND